MISPLTASPAPLTTAQLATVDPLAQPVIGLKHSAQPAVVVNVGKASVQNALEEPVSQKVSDVLSHISGTNGLVDLFNHTDWTALEAKFGFDNINKQRIQTVQSLEGSLASLSHQAGQLGVPVNVSIIPNVGSASGLATASVNAFTFKDGGSTYAVTPSVDGTLVGTKDGQAWATWQLNNQNAIRSSNETGAGEALQTLSAAAKLLFNTNAVVSTLRLAV